MLGRILLGVLLASVVIGALVGIAAILLDMQNEWTGQTVATSAVIAAAALAALLCSIVLERRRVMGIMWLGLGASALAAIAWTTSIWVDLWNYDALAKFSGILAMIVPMTVITGLYSVGDLYIPVFRLTRRVAIGHGWVMTTIGTLLIVFEPSLDDFVGRLLAVATILLILGLILTPSLIFVEFLRGRRRPTDLGSTIRIDLRCPRCTREQTMRAGAHHCVECRLLIRVEIDEPRCTCGYLLYHLTTDRCPECGTALSLEDRWLTAGPTADATGTSTAE